MAAVEKTPSARRNGGANGDPTRNVLDLVEAAVARLDDMRALDSRRLDAELACVKEVALLRGDGLAEIMKLRSEHAEQIRKLTEDRGNAIRLIDVTERKTEADRALTAIATLAQTAQTNAENIRTQLSTTAATLAKQTADTDAARAKQIADQFDGMATRVGKLEQALYTGQGREAVESPAQTSLFNEMRKLIGTKSEGSESTWKMISAALVAAVAVLAIMTFFNKTPQPVVGVEPPVRTAPVTP